MYYLVSALPYVHMVVFYMSISWHSHFSTIK